MPIKSSLDLSKEADEIQQIGQIEEVAAREKRARTINPEINEIPDIDDLEHLLNNNEITLEEFEDYVNHFYPSIWIEAHVTDPIDSEKKIQLWTHQIRVLDGDNYKKAMRFGRQIGKTATLAMKALHIVVHNTNRRVVFYAPQQKHIDNCFGEIDKYLFLCDMMIDLSNKKVVTSEDLGEYSIAMISSTKRPMKRSFSNGSSIEGVVLRTSDDNMGINARGISATDVFFDEAAFIPAGAFSSALLTTRAFVRPTIWVSSTPTLFGIKYKEMCQDETFTEYHVSAEKADNWTDELETFYKSRLSSEEYELDIKATWGDTKEGVFKRRYIEQIEYASQMSFGQGQLPRRYSYDDVNNMIASKMFKYFIIGVDWNKPEYGTRIVVLGVDKTLNLYLLENVRLGRDHDQLYAIEEVMRMDEKYGGQSFIYVDEGYGEYPTAQMHAIGRRKGNGLDERVRPIPTATSWKVTDYFTGEERMDPVNVMVVKTTVLYLERGWLRMPSEERSIENASEISARRQEGTIPITTVMETYVVDRYTPTGRPVYKSNIGDDHSLSALMYAIFGLNQFIRPVHMIDDIMGFGNQPVGTAVVQTPSTAPVQYQQSLVNDKFVNVASQPQKINRPKGENKDGRFREEGRSIMKHKAPVRSNRGGRSLWQR